MPGRTLPPGRADDERGQPRGNAGEAVSAKNSIDIHAHYYPEAYLSLLEREGEPFGATLARDARGPMIAVGEMRVGPLEQRFIDVDLRVAEMDELGVDIQLLSMTLPMLYWAGDDFGLKLAVAYNDSVAEAHQAHPERLYGFAALPMQNPDLAVREVERVARLPGIKGIYLATTILGRELADEAFFPVYECIEAHGLPIFLHPGEVIGMKRLKPYFLANLLGNPFDTAVAAANLIFGGVMDRFPKLEVCLPHAGGAFPYLVGRLNHGWTVRPECKHLEASPFDYLTRFHYDTISHSTDALEYLLSIAGPDRVMLGSDYCFDMGYERPVEIVTGHPGLDEAAKSLVLGGNARRLLGL